MRNLKKVMAAALAAAMLAGMTVTAFADAPSVKATEGAKVESASETEDGGYIIEEGTPEEILKNPKQERTISFLNKVL